MIGRRRAYLYDGDPGAQQGGGSDQAEQATLAPRAWPKTGALEPTTSPAGGATLQTRRLREGPERGRARTWPDVRPARGARH